MVVFGWVVTTDSEGLEGGDCGVDCSFLSIFFAGNFSPGLVGGGGDSREGSSDVS